MQKQNKSLKKEPVEYSTTSEKWTIFLYSTNVVISLGFSFFFFLNFLLLKSNYYKWGSVAYFMVFLGSLYYLHKYINSIGDNQNESSRSRIAPAEPQV